MVSIIIVQKTWQCSLTYKWTLGPRLRLSTMASSICWVTSECHTLSLVKAQGRWCQDAPLVHKECCEGMTFRSCISVKSCDLINGIDSVLKPMPSSTLYHQMFAAMKVNMSPMCAEERFHQDDIPKTVNFKKGIISFFTKLSFKVMLSIVRKGEWRPVKSTSTGFWPASCDLKSDADLTSCTILETINLLNTLQKFSQQRLCLSLSLSLYLRFCASDQMH